MRFSLGKSNEWALYQTTDGEESQWGTLTSYEARPGTTFVIGGSGEVEYANPKEALASLKSDE